MNEKIFQKRSGIFKVGVILVCFWSFLIGFLNLAALYLFGIPFLGLFFGIILVWFAKESFKNKLIFTLVPIPMIASGFLLFYLQLPKAEPEIFLIPHNFRGHIAVVFNEHCAPSLPYENGKRIYDFSKDNIVITDSKESLGVINRKFYLVDGNGNRIEMPEFHWSEFEEEQKDWHWLFSRTKLSKDSVGVFWAYSNNFSFIVSDYHSLEGKDKSAKENAGKIFFHRLESTLKECRQGFSK